MLCWLVVTTKTRYELSAGLPRMPPLHSLLLQTTVQRKGSMNRTLKKHFYQLGATFSCFFILQWRNEELKTAGKGFLPHTEEQDAGRCPQQNPLYSVPISVAIKPQVYNKTSRIFRKLVYPSNHMLIL